MKLEQALLELYMHTYMPETGITETTAAMNLKESKEENLGGFGGKDMKDWIMLSYYNLRKS